jgi:hypothetical protein
LHTVVQLSPLLGFDRRHAITAQARLTHPSSLITRAPPSPMAPNASSG